MSMIRSFQVDVTAEGSRRVKTAGVLLGLGVGGLVDGIVFHQLLQWHHMICFSCHPNATIADVRQNIFVDGLFNITVLVLSVIGIGVLWRAVSVGTAPLRGGLLPGAALVGWGAFNLVEGVIDHHLLGIHHVRPGPYELFYDLAFLAFGALLFAVGLRLMQPARPRALAGA